MSEIIKIIPRYYIICAFVSGFFLLLFSPLHNYLPIWINPFAQEVPTNAATSVGLFAVFSLGVGFPTLFLDNAIVGNSGVNATIFRYIRRTHTFKYIWSYFGQTSHYYLDKILRGKIPEHKENMENSIELSSVRAAIWAAKSGAGAYISAINYNAAIISGIVVGAELAFITDLLVLVIFTFLSISTLGLACLALEAFSICLGGCLYNRFFFRLNYNNNIEKIIKEFQVWEKENYPPNVP